MAEKEERILHIVQKLDGRFVGENRITRTEAIERMAKAICPAWGLGTCQSCAFKGNGSMCQDFIDAKKELAEAALNALLEGK